MKFLELVKRVQAVMTRENTIATLEEALYQLNIENKKRRDIESKFFDEHLHRCHAEKLLKSFRENP